MLSIFVSSNLIVKRLGLKSLEGSPELSELGLSNTMIWQLLWPWASVLQNFWPNHHVPSCLCPSACVFPSARTPLSPLWLLQTDFFLSRFITPYLSFRTYLGHFLSKENGQQRLWNFHICQPDAHSPAPKNTRTLSKCFCVNCLQRLYKSLKKKRWGGVSSSFIVIPF